MTGPAKPVTLAQIVAALSVTYKDEGIAVWLRAGRTGLNGASPLQFIEAGDIEKIAFIVRCIGDADPSDFTITEAKR